MLPSSALIQYVESDTSYPWQGYFYALALFVVTIIRGIINQKHFLGKMLSGIRIRSAITAAVYRKVKHEPHVFSQIRSSYFDARWHPNCFWENVICITVHRALSRMKWPETRLFLYPQPTKLGGGGGGVYWIHLVRPSVRPSVEHKSSFLWNFNFKLHMPVDGGHRQKPIDFQRRHFQNGRLVAILDFLVSGLELLLWLWISTLNFSGTMLMYMGRSLFC